MTTNQDRRLNMYQTVRDFLIANGLITKDLPNFGSSLQTLQETIKHIRSISEMQKDITTGISKEKRILKENLITMAADNSRKISALAKFTNNPALLDKIKFSVSELEKMKENDLKDYAQIIFSKAEANIQNLASYGITEESQKNFAEAITNFEASVPKPRVGITGKAQATKQLTLLFQTADSSIENLDAAIGIIRLKEVIFFNGYQTARKLVDTGTGRLALKATVKDLKDGTPIRGAIMIFKSDADQMRDSGGNGEYIKKTAAKGSLNIKNMLAGTYKVVVRKPGYKEKEAIVSVADGERSELVVELEKA